MYIEAGDRINLVFLFINIYKSYYLSYKYRLIPIVFHVNVLFFSYKYCINPVPLLINIV